MKFLNLFLGAATVGSVLTAPTSDTAVLPKTDKRASKFKFVGVNQSGAEFGNKVLPGKLGKEYTWPVRSSIDVGLSSFHLSPEADANEKIDIDRQGNEHFSGCVHDVRLTLTFYKPGKGHRGANKNA
jgi:hypothetical protein